MCCVCRSVVILHEEGYWQQPKHVGVFCVLNVCSLLVKNLSYVSSLFLLFHSVFVSLIALALCYSRVGRVMLCYFNSSTYLFTYLLTYLLTYILTYLLNYSIQHSPSWEVNRFEASQEIPHTLWKLKVHYRIHKHAPPVPVLSQFNPIHIPTF
jgi:hypothetical protein